MNNNIFDDSQLTQGGVPKIGSEAHEDLNWKHDVLFS